MNSQGLNAIQYTGIVVQLRAANSQFTSVFQVQIVQIVQIVQNPAPVSSSMAVWAFRVLEMFEAAQLAMALSVVRKPELPSWLAKDS